MDNDVISQQSIVDYYDHCWGRRFRSGHNARSRAIHYGVHSSEGDGDSEAAKLRTNQQLAQLASIDASHGPIRILDAGCGVGGTVIDVALANGNVEAVGVTLSAEQVQLASEFAKACGVSDRVSFAKRDYTDTGLAEHSFDVVWAVESLCHAKNRRAFFREAQRLLRPGGRLVVADFFRTDQPLDSQHALSYLALCRGFAISDYYNEPLPAVAADVGWSTVQTVRLTDRVLPDVARSALKAHMRLNESSAVLTPLEHAHLLTCALMHPFCVEGLLDYRHYRFEPR